VNDPITATHISLRSNEYLRLTKGVYAEVYLNGWWVECATLRNSDLIGGVDCILNRAEAINKTGWRKALCNLRLFLIGSKYRAGESKSLKP